MKKLLSIILAILMIVTTIPMAFAAEEMTVLTEFCIYEDDYNYPGGWSNDNEENYHLGIQDQGKIAWEEGDELLIIFNEYDTDTWEKINTQTALLRYENEQFNGSISFVYDENSYIVTYGCIGKGGGTDEYLEIHCVIIDNVLYIVFPYSHVHYSRLRIVGEANTSYDVTVDGFITADNFEKLITQNYTLTTDNNGNAYLYGTFIEGAILSVNGVSCTFDPPEPTLSEKSYAVCAVHNFSDGYCTECYVKCAHANCSNSVCNDCGYICLHSDTLVQVDAKAPTCTHVGNEAYEYCTVCDYTTTYAEIPVDTDAHDIVIDEAVAPNCANTGLTQGEHCTRCDYKVEQEIVPALNHKDTLVQVDAKAPTCSAAGYEAYEYCTACDYTTYVEKEALNHKDTIVKVSEKFPTCTESGYYNYEYCTACDYTTYVERPSLGGHTPSGWWVKTESEHYKHCVNDSCSEEIAGTRGAHVYENYKISKAATCTSNAEETGKCICGKTDTRVVPDSALKHSFTKYETTQEAKCGVEGKEVAACDNGCGETDEKAIDALTHKDADGDYKCDNGCGHEFEKPAPEEPAPDTPDEPTDEACDHLCHKGGFMGFIWKIVKFFWKLFKMNPVCECGAAHY